MNTHMTTEAYREGYRSFLSEDRCPYNAGSTKQANWKEGYSAAINDTRALIKEVLRRLGHDELDLHSHAVQAS